MPLASWEQGYRTGAKQGTVYYATGTAVTSCITDLSQEATNLTAGTNCAYAFDDPRFDRGAPRTVLVRATLSTATSGTLYLQGESGFEQRITNAAGVVTLQVNGSTVGTLTPTGLTGTGVAHQLAWVTEANPEATGASDAEISWLVTWNEITNTASRAGPFIHEEYNPAFDIVVFGAASNTGTSAFSGRISAISFHHRAMTLTEIYSTYVTAAGTLSTDTQTSPEALPYTLAMGIGDQNELHGPATVWAGRNHHQLRRRTVTGRSIRLDPVEIDSTYHSGNSRVRLATWSALYRWRLGWCWPIPVAPTVSHLWVRMHCDLWVTSGAAVPTGLRIYSANRPPVLADAAGSEPYDHKYIESVVTRNDGGSGAGSWTVEGFLPIVRGREGMREGWTYIMPAYSIDPASASANDANARLIVNAIQFAPCFRPPDDGAGPALPGEGA